MGWTRNFKNTYINKFIHRTSPNSSKPSDTSGYVFDDTNTYILKAHDGTLINILNKSHSWTFLSTYLHSPVIASGFDFTEDTAAVHRKTNAYLAFGSSSAEESIDDYKIEVINTVVQQGSLVISGVLDENGNLVISYKATLKSETDANINEIGLYMREVTTMSTSYGSAFMALMYRKKLEEPIILNAGVPVNVNFSITIANPVAEY